MRTIQLVCNYFVCVLVGTIIAPTQYLSGILELCHSKRGEQRSVTNIDQTRLNIQFLFPLNEIVTNFYDELKSISSGTCYRPPSSLQKNFPKEEFHVHVPIMTFSVFLGIVRSCECFCLKDTPALIMKIPDT